MASTTSKIVTCEESLRMPAVDGREEVVDREIVRTPPAEWIHSLTVHRLLTPLPCQLDDETLLVMTSVSGLVIRQEPLSCREPDRAIFKVDIASVWPD